MKLNPLGRTGIMVPEICIGTMTWGNQNTEAEGHEQMDYALAHGANFWDAAELYPAIPIGPETQGRTEEIIGTWFKSRRKREEVILATKVGGVGIEWIQDGSPISSTKIAKSVESSLKRLQTDYIDLYQLHWPNRGHYHFRRQWAYTPSEQPKGIEQETLDILGELGRLVDAGKIRAIGLSNDTAWGTAEYLRLAEAHDLPRIASIQNEYSMMYRPFDLDLAELSHHEDVGLLAYSPLASGILSGKYSGGAIPKGSRADLEPGMSRKNETSLMIADKYVALARQHGLDPSAMAIAFCLTRPFMASAIIGATSMAQLEIAVSAKDIILSEDVMEGIAEIHKAHPAPF